MTAVEQRDRSLLEPRLAKALWLFESGNPPEPVRQYARDKLTAFYLTLGGSPETTPKKITRRAHGILNEVVEATKGTDPSIEQRFVIAAQFALKHDPKMADIALDNAKGRLVRGIRAMSLLIDLNENDFKFASIGGSHGLEGALLTLANEILDRDKAGENDRNEDRKIIQLDVQSPVAEEPPILKIPLIHKEQIIEIPTTQASASPFDIEVSTDRYKALFNNGRDFRDLTDRRNNPLKEIPVSTRIDEQAEAEIQRQGVTRSVIIASEPRKIRKDKVSIGPNFGRRVGDLRKALGFSRDGLLGLGRGENLRQIEAGQRKAISKVLAQEIAEKLGITLADLFNDDLSVEAIVSKTPRPDSQIVRKVSIFTPKVQAEEGLTDAEIRVKRFQEGLQELKRKGIAKMGERKIGEIFLCRDNDGREYSLVQDGRLRTRSKTGVVKMERFEDTTNSTVISALQREIGKK